MRKLFTFLTAATLLIWSAQARVSGADLSAKGQVVLQYVDGESGVTRGGASAGGSFFWVQPVDHDPTTDYSRLDFSFDVNPDVSGKLSLIPGQSQVDAGGGFGTAGSIDVENLYLEVHNIEGLPEGTSLRAGQFFPKFGLGVFDGFRNNNVLATCTACFADRFLDAGVEISGAFSQWDYSIALTDGIRGNNAKAIWVDLPNIYKEEMPIGLSYFAGKNGAGNALRAYGVDLETTLESGLKIGAEYILANGSGAGDPETNYFYGSLRWPLSGASVYAKYYLVDPKRTKGQDTWVFGYDFEYAENAKLGIEYILNNEDGTEVDNNVIKGFAKLSF